MHDDSDHMRDWTPIGRRQPRAPKAEGQQSKPIGREYIPLISERENDPYDLVIDSFLYEDSAQPSGRDT